MRRAQPAQTARERRVRRAGSPRPSARACAPRARPEHSRPPGCPRPRGIAPTTSFRRIPSSAPAAAQSRPLLTSRCPLHSKAAPSQAGAVLPGALFPPPRAGPAARCAGAAAAASRGKTATCHEREQAARGRRGWPGPRHALKIVKDAAAHSLARCRHHACLCLPTPNHTPCTAAMCRTACRVLRCWRRLPAARAHASLCMQTLPEPRFALH